MNINVKDEQNKYGKPYLDSGTLEKEIPMFLCIAKFVWMSRRMIRWRRCHDLYGTSVDGMMSVEKPQVDAKPCQHPAGPTDIWKPKSKWSVTSESGGGLLAALLCCPRAAQVWCGGGAGRRHRGVGGTRWVVLGWAVNPG